MSKTQKITQLEASKRYAKFGLFILEDYINNRIKIKTRCKCGKTFYTEPGKVFLGESENLRL